jgi:2'-hydroxyisoflavone reductase
MKTTRRDFLYTTAAAGGALSLGAFSDAAAEDRHIPKASEPLDLLILGGSAFTGPFQIKYALERGHKVTIFNRGRTQPTMHPEVFDQIEKLVGDRDNDLEALKGRTWDAVIDNSATRPRWVRQSTDILKGNCDTYLFTSSLSVHADFSKIGITEDDAVATIDDPTTEEITGETYGALKALSEDVVREAFPDGAIILRPHLIVGPGDPTDRWTYWPVRVDRGGEVMAPGTPNDLTQYIDTRDLAEFGVTLVENRSLGTYSGVGPLAPLNMGGMLYGIRAVVINEVSFTWVPADFLAEHEVAPWAHMPAWIPPEGEFAGFGAFDNSRSVAAGLKYRPLADTAKATIDWWKAQPEERTAEPRAGLAPEREAEVLAAWHARAEESQ